MPRCVNIGRWGTLKRTFRVFATLEKVRDLNYVKFKLEFEKNTQKILQTIGKTLKGSRNSSKIRIEQS
jgi:hypothetical protein